MFLDGNGMHHLKRTVKCPGLLPEQDDERVRFPGGIFCEVIPKTVSEIVKRIEIIGDKKNPLGLLREIFVAYASNPVLLDLARRSDYVIEARRMRWRKKHFAEAYTRDRLVLKRFANEEDFFGDRILAPSQWISKMGMNVGDVVMLSNPLSNFAMPQATPTQTV